MKYLLTSLFLFFLFIDIHNGYAQESDFKPPTEADIAYQKLRTRRTIPPYGLEKINRLIKTIEEKYLEDGDASISALTASMYNGLTLREKFTYVMVNPEMYSQNCAIFIPLPEENKKIFAHLMSWVDEATWSDRQIKFLKENRDSIMSIIKESTLRSRYMGINYKEAIELINGWEFIPFLIEYYKSNPTDKDALTLLLLLMKRGEYKEFLESSSYKKLYGSDYNYEKWINYNTANEQLILDRANGYYQSKLKN